MKLKALPATVLIAFLLSLFITYKVFASVSTYVNASIQIGVCGDGSVATGEDCDGTNLNSKTCVSLGYGGGALKCDISCSFDTSGCIEVTPTPTPTIEPSPVSQTSLHITIPTPTISVAVFPTLAAKPQSVLPSPLQKLIISANGNSHISVSNLPVILKAWVTDWKNFLIQQPVAQKNTPANNVKSLACDVNNDGVCDVKDLSVLLYYVGK